jgi:hypothetical protein
VSKPLRRLLRSRPESLALGYASGISFCSRVRGRRVVRWLVPLLTGALVASALAYDGSRQEASFTLAEQRTGRATAERFVFDYVNPDDPEAKPPAVRRVVTVLPRGAGYDTSVPGSCTASDAQLMLEGATACPADSAIGGGVVTVDSGAPEPGRIVTADVEFFNNATDAEGEFIFLNTVRGSSARTVIRADVTRRRTITDAGMLPGAPPDGGAIDTVDLTVAEVSRRIDGERRNYITTPRRCPKRGHWNTRVHFTYGDGVTQTVKSASECKRKGAR